MTSFKQFLLEGGAATAKQNTQRANKTDIVSALKFVAKHAGVPEKDLYSKLLGSTSHTLAGKKKDSGDIDIALEEGNHDREAIVAKMKKATAMEDVHVTGGNTYSFAVPVPGNKKVQVDLMFVPSEKWAKFGYHSAHDSAYKGLVRNNFLLDNVMKHTYEPGKDMVVKDENGDELVRVRRVFGRGEGLVRKHRARVMRKDGKGRVQIKTVTPEQVEEVLKQLGKKAVFAKEADPIIDPDAAAAWMFGKGTKAADLLSAEQVIKAIFKRKDHAAIFKDVIKDFKEAGIAIPAELKTFE